jgi:tetratricopeptide (TPR) repeat protein
VTIPSFPSAIETDTDYARWVFPLLSKATRFAFQKGRLEEAKDLGVQTLEAAQKIYGLEHDSTLRATVILGSILNAQRNSKEAEALYRLALASYERSETRSEDQLNVVCHLAAALSNQRNSNEAETMYRRASSDYEKLRVNIPPYPELLVISAMCSNFKKSTKMQSGCINSLMKVTMSS